MKNILLLFAIILLSCKTSPSVAAEMMERIVPTAIAINEINNDASATVTRTLYKGTLNKTIQISMYINEQEHPCGGDSTLLNVMYKYDSQKKWILLNSTTNKSKTNFCMVEDNFSGVLFLAKTGDSFHGKWISPDTTKQFEVTLEKVLLDKITNEALEEILFDDLIFSKNDC